MANMSNGKYVKWQGRQITVLVWENTSTVMKETLWTKSDRVQELFGQHSPAQGMTLAVACVEPGVGFNDSDGFLPT